MKKILSVLTVVFACVQNVLCASISGADGEKFINDLGANAVKILTSTKLNQEQSKTQFASLLRKGFDLEYIAMFSLGSYRRSAKPEELKIYQGLFEKWLIEKYGAKFGEYKGVALKVTGSSPGARGSLVVSSIMTNPKDNQQVSVDWSLHRDKKNEIRIRDVLIEGVSMSTNHRSDFASIISRGGNNFSVLIDALRKNVH